MRTTIDIPDALYKTLKTRAVLSGTTLRELVLRLLEQGMRSPREESTARRDAPPVIVPATGRPIPPLSKAKLRRLEEEEDEAKHARSS